METHTHNWLERTELLLGSEKLELLRNAHVLVVGLGGVGAYAAEMIARAGVGRMTVADADTVNATNINRQLVALHSTVGRPKAEVLAERLRDINPGIGLTVVNKYIKDEETYMLAGRRALRLRGGRHRHPLAQTGADNGRLAGPRAAAGQLDGRRSQDRPHEDWRSPTSRKPTTARWPTCCASGSTRSASAAGSGPYSRPSRCAKGRMILCEEQNKKSNVGTISYIPALFGIGCASVVIRDLIGELEG